MPTRLQMDSASGDFVSSLGKAFSSNVTANSLIVVVLTSYYGDSTFSSPGVTDTLGNTYAQATAIGDATSEATTVLSQYIYYAISSSGGANTVTFNGMSGAYVVMTILEYSGIASSGTLNASAKKRYDWEDHGFVSTSTFTSTSLTTTEADALLVGGAGSHSTSDVYTGDSGWSEIGGIVGSSHGHRLFEQIVSSTGSYTLSGTLSSNQNIISTSLAAFKAAGGGGTFRTARLTLVGAGRGSYAA